MTLPQYGYLKFELLCLVQLEAAIRRLWPLTPCCSACVTLAHGQLERTDGARGQMLQQHCLSLRRVDNQVRTPPARTKLVRTALFNAHQHSISRLKRVDFRGLRSLQVCRSASR